MRKTCFLVTMLCVLLSFSRCATIVSKRQYPVYIHTEPKGAVVSITNKKGKIIFKGTTPAVLSVEPGAGYFSRAEYQVRLTMPGYEEKTVPIRFKLNAWYFGNIIFGGVLGLLIIDPLTGAMWKLSDPLVDETMVKKASVTVSPQLRIIDIRSLPAETVARLERIR